MKFFGEADRDKDGTIKSEYPAWYQRQQMEDLEESVRHMEYNLEKDLIRDRDKPEIRARLKREKELLDKINHSKAEIKGAEDMITKGVKDFGSHIKDSMYTRTDMQRGTADAHEEARRISEPVISIKSKEMAELAEACGIKPKDGKISRAEAEKIWKIGSRALGESSNVETLRRG